MIGTIDEASAFQQVHPQAIYLHEAETYFVRDLDIVKKIAFIEKTNVDYYTQSITETQVKVDREEKSGQWRISPIAFGDVSVTDLTFMFRKIKFGSRDSIGYGKCDLPPQVLETAGMWIEPPGRRPRRGAKVGDGCRPRGCSGYPTSSGRSCPSSSCPTPSISGRR